MTMGQRNEYSLTGIRVIILSLSENVKLLVVLIYMLCHINAYQATIR
jgi:hypothetical protein